MVVTTDDIRDATIQARDIASGVIPSGGGELPNVHIVQGPEVTVTENQPGSSLVDCPDGEILTGGGFSVGGEILTRASFPVDENTWRVLVSPPPGSTGQTFNAYAMCIGPSP